MDMNVHFFAKVLRQSQHLCTAADVGIACLRRFLHHVTKLTGQRQAALALEGQHLNLEQLAAHARPGQAISHAHSRLHRQILVKEDYRAEIFFQILFCYLCALSLAFNNAHGHLAADSRQLALQVTHAGLTCIIMNYTADSLLAHRNLIFFQTVELKLLRQQMNLRNLHLFLVCIAAELDNLHSVEQRRRNSLCCIGRHNPEYM